jgi:hypothetical protein
MFQVYFTGILNATGRFKYNKKLYSVYPLLMVFTFSCPYLVINCVTAKLNRAKKWQGVNNGT